MFYDNNPNNKKEIASFTETLERFKKMTWLNTEN
jgi:hypothetical protein